MFSEKVTLVNPQGFHMRPASLPVGEPGNSLMGIMAAGIKCGEEIEIQAECPQENEAGRAVVDFIASGMGD